MTEEVDSLSLESEQTKSSASGPKSITFTSIRHHWSSSVEYIFISILYCISTDNFSRIKYTNLNSPNMVQYLICMLVVGMPIQYMQVSIGQYTQMPAIFLKYMSPVGHGIGYAFLIATIFRLLPMGTLAGDCLLYFLNSMQAKLPWYMCKRAYRNFCWDGPICKNQDCISDKVFAPAYVYWNHTFMQTIPAEAKLTGPDIRRLVTVSTVWIIVYCILIFTKHITKRILKYMFFVSFCILNLIVLVLIAMTDGATNGLRILMELSFNQFLEPNLWMKAMTDMVAMTSLGRGGFILAGSYLSASSSSGLITVMADIIFVIFVSVFTIMFHINFAILSTAAKLHKANMSQAVGNPNEPVELTIIPNGLGYTNVPQLWNVLYFLASIIFCYSFIIINVRIVEITIEDSHMNFRRYRKYILFAFLSVTLIGSVIFVSNGLYMYTVVKYKQSLDYFEVFITFTFTMLVSWIYGVQKLCDDIHFIIGVQPARYWKICWYFAPLVLGIVCLLQIKEMSDEMNIYTMIAVALLGCPLTVMSIIETFRYIKRRNLLGLFQPEEHWGPPEQSIRHLRLIFNPRKEVRSRRRNETCQHKCLLGSKALKRVIYEEEKFQTTFEDAQQQKQNQTVEENQQNALKDNP